MVRIRSALPAVTVFGESELMVIDPREGVGDGDGVGECGCTEAEPPPQPDNATTPAIANAVPVSHLIEPPCPLFEDLRRFFAFALELQCNVI
jgi:hypothetical protein